MLRAMAREVLESYGYTVLEARHGPQALEISEGHKGPIHLLMTDVVIPHMSGRELAERLAASRPEARVLYTSGYTDDEVIRGALLQASASFLQKPYGPEALARKVRDVLAGPREPTP